MRCRHTFSRVTLQPQSTCARLAQLAPPFRSGSSSDDSRAGNDKKESAYNAQFEGNRSRDCSLRGTKVERRHVTMWVDRLLRVLLLPSLSHSDTRRASNGYGGVCLMNSTRLSSSTVVIAGSANRDAIADWNAAS